MKNQTTALLEFSVENFKIFKNKATFSMIAPKMKQGTKHILEIANKKVLKTSLIYGPNASGKSSLLEAMEAYRFMVLDSINQNTSESEPFFVYKPFALSKKIKKEVFFELSLAVDKKIFVHSFSILRNKISQEKLIQILANGNEVICFERKGQDIKGGRGFTDIKDIITKTKERYLFLPVANQWNNKLAEEIVEAIRKIKILSFKQPSNYSGYTIQEFKKNKEMKNKILELLSQADFSIKDGAVFRIDPPMEVRRTIEGLMPKIKNNKSAEFHTVIFTHPKYDEFGKEIGVGQFNISEESEGTKSFFEMLGPIINSIEENNILLVDELDNSLHPFLTKLVVDLFEQKSQGAQLIATTHDTTLLSHPDLKKAHFWFTEKNKFGASRLFSLAEFKFNLRNDTEYANKYLEGRFGALPYIKD